MQFEKSRRSNIDGDSGNRKTARYNSQNVLSGLLVCAECGSNYRRITPTSGEVVWRCGNRVEHGHEVCKHSPTIPESEVIELICMQLDMEVFDESQVRKEIDHIEILAGDSGRIICAECGRPYRRITRTNHDGGKEIVWRCASRIEHGSKICKHSPTISESEVIGLICKQLNLETFDESQVRQKIDRIEILTGASPSCNVDFFII